MRTRRIQEAKARLCKLVREAEHAGLQAITWCGLEVAMVPSKADYDSLAGAGQSLVGFTRRSPWFGADDVDLTRDTNPACDLAL